MATNILPFEGKTLPAYLKNVDKTAPLNDDLVSSGAGFPVISIKGKTFAIVRGGEREILPNPKDPDSPATSIDVVILKANKGMAKIYYPKRYEEGDDSKPVCYSNDGITPALDVEEQQSPKCATCKRNVWGARITDQGKKAKECQDGKRLAVTTPDQLNEPYLIRVPPASLSNLTEYAQFLAKRGVKYNMVVTKITFDADVATPKLMFKAIGLLDETGYGQVQEALKLDVVDKIVGAPVDASFEQPSQTTAATATATPTLAPVKAKAAAEQAIKAAQATTPAPAATAKFAAAPVAAAAPEQIEEPEVEVNLDNLSFDD
jgi:hypothetical protein